MKEPRDYFSIPSISESSTPNSGCRELLLAIIEDVFTVKRLATRSAGKGLKKQQKIDEKWISSNDDGVMTFQWCCAHLQISPTKIRRLYFSESDHEEKLAA